MRETFNNPHDQKISLDNTSSEGLNSQDDEIDLIELFRVIWAEKILIIGVTSFFTVTALLYALLQPNIYRAEALLAPVDTADSASSLASRFGGLASLAGVSLSDGNKGKTSLAIEYMQSREFLKTFMENHPDVLPALMAVDKWHSIDNRLEFDTSKYIPSTDQWVRKVPLPKQPRPSVQEAHRAFKDILSISQDKDSSFVTLAIDHQSPFLAAQWVAWLVEDVNNTLRNNDIAQAERSIAYLQSEINSTSISEMRSRLFELIQSQTQTIMLAKASPEYIFKTVDPAVVPELKLKPKRALIVLTGTVIGGMLAVFIVLVRSFLMKTKVGE